METCNELPIKKPKRSFVEAWLSDERYKFWIRKVSSDDSFYHCIICNKNFSCNAAHVSRHVDSACHLKKLQENIKPQTQVKSEFQQKWLEINSFKLWLRDIPHDKSLCLCTICDKTFDAHLSHIHRHAASASHLNLVKQKGIEASNDFNTQDESPLSFDERRKSAEIRYAALIAEKNVPYQTAKDILKFFQDIGEDPYVLKNMSMGRTKCKNIISNVLCPIENKHVVHNLQITKFSVFIDETSDISNEKWMTFFVRYVHPETLDIRSQLVKLINIDAKDCSADKLFHAFKCEMWKLQIPFLNIIALSCDNASVMTGKYSSFKTKLENMCKHLLTFPCPCHSAALVAHAACAKIPSFCDDFLKKVTNYINSSPKRLAIFAEFCECFQAKYRTILKLSETRWLSHHACVERLLDSWDTIQRFLQEMVVSDKKAISAEHLLLMMSNLEIKAYFLFLKYILHFFNAFNAFFQSTETRIHLLQIKSVNFLSQICQNFLKQEYLKDVTTIIDFSRKEIQKDINDIYVGSECEEYLKNLMTEGHADALAIVRQNCLQFYLTAAEEIRKRLPINDNFLKMLQVFKADPALSPENREITIKYVLFVARTLGGFNEVALKKEWFVLPTDVSQEKDEMSKLHFDEMWRTILQRQSNNIYKYPILRNLLSAIRALPNSNADPERMFSILTDLKTKKRNKLNSVSVNSTCVIKSALKTRGETAINMKITEQHLSCMTTDKLYIRSEKKPKSCLNVYAAEEEEEANVIDDVGLSSSMQ